MCIIFSSPPITSTYHNFSFISLEKKGSHCYLIALLNVVTKHAQSVFYCDGYLSSILTFLTLLSRYIRPFSICKYGYQLYVVTR